MDFDYKKIIKIVSRKNFISRSIILILAIFTLALNYNLFLLPHNLVTGGMSGLAIIFEKLLGWDSGIFLFIAGAILLICSFIFLGKEKSMKTIVGALLFPLFITLSKPLAEILIPYFQFESFLFPLAITSLLYGTSCGLIYKMGFTTGGGDIIMQIVSKYVKLPLGTANLITNGIVVAVGGLFFGINKVLYAIIILYASTVIIDKIIIGISDSKMFFIHTKQLQKVREFILKEMNAGATMFNIEGGYTEEMSKMLMCVVRTRDYYIFKESVLTIDPAAFFVISDCYEVKGGVKRSNLPFI